MQNWISIIKSNWIFSKIYLLIYIYIYIYVCVCVFVFVGSQFEAQAQNVWSLGPRSSIQWICREWVGNLDFCELDDRPIGFDNKERKITKVY